jgi:hypothetical protein
MTFNGGSELHAQYRWLAVVAIGGPMLFAAWSTGHITVASIIAGIVTWAFGELVHNQDLRRDGPIPDLEGTASAFGVALNLFGIALVVLALYRFWKYGYWPISKML